MEVETRAPFYYVDKLQNNVDLLSQPVFSNNIQKDINGILVLFILFNKAFYHYWSIYIISILQYMTVVTQYWSLLSLEQSLDNDFRI